jgi:hypothetical protein
MSYVQVFEHPCMVLLKYLTYGGVFSLASLRSQVYLIRSLVFDF